MAIHEFAQNRRLPVIGKIRLGIRKTAQSGNEYPESVPHFVLHDAPEIEKAYGKDPVSIDAFFLTDDINLAIPHWLKWYKGGSKDKKGNVVGGDLQCYGEGAKGANDDGSLIPGKAWHLAKRDPLTRIIPDRECLGPKCPDYYDSRGKVQCGPSMSVHVFVPLASMYGIFVIDTKSKTSIGQFLAQVNMLKDTYGKLKGIPFKIYRDPMSLPVPDKPGTRKTHYILSIKPNESFMLEHGEEVKKKIATIMCGNILGPTEGEMIEAPMEDNYPVITDESGGNVPVTVEAKVDAAKVVAECEEAKPLFEELSALTKKVNNEQSRLLTARKFEKEANPKEAMVKYLMEALFKLKFKGTPAPAAVVEPAAPEVVAAVAPAAGPVPDKNGLI